MPEQQIESLFELESGETFYWAHCAIEGCSNMVCRRADDRLCFPHMPEWKQRGYLMMLDWEEKNGK